MLQGQLSQTDAGQCVLLWVHPGLEGGVVLPFPLWVLQPCLVDLFHSLEGQRRLGLSQIPSH